ncbi:ABC transporter ATP-binding protein [Nocardiopsis sp. CNS-639]|uniref:ABC transporter ATP-binding protein n=1 Tax=Nocardiopsis sp. CNS-639 TaxID=1169153 RepID=UPI0003763AFC|nr:ABC transporter ATP-binding protein [Nocardiopsis sp. CNS-639]
MLTVRELTKRYGGRTAVDGLTFTVEPGRVTGFLGPNGAGKSTTMRMMLGLARPTSGEALINGREYGRLDRPTRRVGALLSPDAAHPGRSARAHLTAKAAGGGIPRSRVDEVLEEVGLTGVARQRVHGYSLGMRQRLGVADALLGDPGVLLFDEPVNGLDLDGVRWMRDLTRRLADEGRTVFVSSHLMSEMEMVADHLVVVGRGRLIADAPISDVIAAWSRTHVLVRSPDAARLREGLERLGPSVRVEAEEDTWDDRGVRGVGEAGYARDGSGVRDVGESGDARGALGAEEASDTRDGGGARDSGEPGSGRGVRGAGETGAERSARGAGGGRDRDGSRDRGDSWNRGDDRGTGLRVFGLGVAEVGDHAHAVGARIHGLRLEEASLEEAYLELTGDSVEYGARSGPAASGRDASGNAAPAFGNAPGDTGPAAGNPASSGSTVGSAGLLRRVGLRRSR